jgi:feruloyl esterase
MLNRSFIRQLCLLFLLTALSLLASAQPSSGASSPKPLNLPVVDPAIDCSSLAVVDISKSIGASARIISAQVVNDGKVAAYCKVKVNIDDFIDFEVHLPVAKWSQRLLFSGNGYLPPAGTGEWVTTTWSDLGHRAHEEVFANDYEHRVDYGYRSMHLIVLSSKALAGKYYGRGPKYTYYAACSEPAREGMVDLERYPDDYDGVAAGCTPMPMTVNNGIYNTWNMVLNARPDGSAILHNDKLPLIHQTVLDQCDAADGLKDGLISAPYSCHPDLSVIQCKPGQDASTCLSADEIRVTMEVYRSAHDDKGNQLVPTGPLPGSELAWAGLIASGSSVAANYQEARDGTAKAVRSLYSDPPLPESFQISDIKFDKTTFDALTKLHYIYDGTDPDLIAFAKAGHKLLLWHGLADVMVPTAYSLNYYAALQKTLGQKTVDSFVRFYLFPGVYHCGGGQGPGIRDFLAPLTLWVEQGIAPDALNAAHVPQSPNNLGPGSSAQTNNAPDMTRPIYPYPYTSKYTGKGDIHDAANFVKGPPMVVPDYIYHWFGSSLYTPDYLKDCTGVGTTFECKNSR